MIRDRHRDTLRMLETHADFNDATILEIGCGPGRVTRMYAERAGKVVGIEPEFEAVRTAAEAVPRAAFLCGSGMSLPFPDSTFDIVLFTLSLHHHPDCLGALAEARRVVDRHGRVLVIEPTPQSEIQRLCTVFEDEDHRLDAVERTLPGHHLTIKAREQFVTHWEFTDFKDVTDYGFTYYDHPPDAEKEAALRTFLGPKANEAPIRLTDTLRLTVLSSDS